MSIQVNNCCSKQPLLRDSAFCPDWILFNFFSNDFTRAIVKELPRVMTIYDVDLPLKSAREAINFHFRKNKSLEDGR
jgi:hypothetical protein